MMQFNRGRAARRSALVIGVAVVAALMAVGQVAWDDAKQHEQIADTAIAAVPLVIR